MGTVMLKEETKIKLIKVAAELQQQAGKRIDFDEAISYLIDLYRNKTQDWEQFDIFCKPMKGVKKSELIEELNKGRKEDEKRFSID